MTAKRPIGEDCQDALFQWLIDDEWARGIVKIHEGCEPPCPRKQSALDHLSQVSGR
ncbi:hypothetical protein [Nocardia asiatica]|uniref:hypothetical protein n=1 Tax=Nocardia asiatica TaxID=209252 RepID=UPI0002D39052|nr:hypothetical protein [Nocardia asiatica]